MLRFRARKVSKTETVRARILTFVRQHPGLTAWTIAKALGAKSSTVSSILCKLAYSERLNRRDCRHDGKPGPWRYYTR